MPISPERAIQVANRLNAQLGRPPVITPNDRVDPLLGARIASMYEAMPNTPWATDVRRSYHALVTEVERQYAAIPIPVEFTSTDPYKGSRDLHTRVPVEGILRVYTGGSDHPILTPEQNWKFRAVHDFFAHFAHGNEFGPTGEERAFQAHRQMFPVEAHLALALETRAQNSWFNFSRTNIDRVPTARQFAQQKVGRLPAEATMPTHVA